MLKVLLEAVMKLTSFFGVSMSGNTYGGWSASALSDAANSYNTQTKNVNITMTNNASGVITDQTALIGALQDYMDTSIKTAIQEI